VVGRKVTTWGDYLQNMGGIYHQLSPGVGGGFLWLNDFWKSLYKDAMAFIRAREWNDDIIGSI
jgi:hypothetical protein